MQEGGSAVGDEARCLNFEWELHSQVQEGGVTVGGKDQDQVKPWDGKVPERGGTVED